MRDTGWYQTQLNRYFEKNYDDYEDEIEWYSNPNFNMWKFYIPSLKEFVVLTCDENGRVTEESGKNV